ncbi:MAG: DHH family phosphoesterase, partial [Oscillospiraceae bacterium]|nr:DHH family phosphoesterase [Oscillospiraceae bacterium]
MTRNEVAQWLAGHDNYVILTHRRPDGDAIGSACALCRGLRKIGKTAHVLENREATTLTAPLMEGLTCADAGENDTVITVDMASPGMFSKESAHLADRCQLRIDHHDTGAPYSPNELVDAGAAACGDVIYDVLMTMGVELDCDIAKALYVAVSTDTGCFRFANTNAHAYQVAAACAATGADLYPLTQALFDTNSMGKLKIQSWIVEHAHIFADGRGAVCAIPKAVEETVTKDDLEGIPGFLRSIEGVKMSATLRSTEDGAKMSVRAIPGYDCTAICGL